jgi:hypothetical protein
MNSKIKIGIVAVLFAQLSFAAPVHSGLVENDERQSSHQEFSSSRLGRSLTLVLLSPLIIEDQTVGEIVVYDDPGTKRPADYFGLYDSTGDLVAVGWFDQFGIQRIAVDRGLVEDQDEPQRTFVYLVDGQLI